MFDTCVEVLFLVYPMVAESCAPRVSKELNMFNGIIRSGLPSPLRAGFLDAHGLYNTSISTDSVSSE